MAMTPTNMGRRIDMLRSLAETERGLARLERLHGTKARAEEHEERAIDRLYEANMLECQYLEALRPA